MKPQNSYENLGQLFIVFSNPLGTHRLSIDWGAVSTDRVGVDVFGVIPYDVLSRREVISIVSQISVD